MIPSFSQLHFIIFVINEILYFDFNLLFNIQLLRFFGYFTESVVESRLENYRIRKVIMYYFLEDRSILITEPKQVNSGTPQGAFLKRQVVVK